MRTIDTVLKLIEAGILDAKEIGVEILRWFNSDDLREYYNYYNDTDLDHTKDDFIFGDLEEWITQDDKIAYKEVSNLASWLGGWDFTDFMDYYLRVWSYPTLEELKKYL